MDSSAVSGSSSISSPSSSAPSQSTGYSVPPPQTPTLKGLFSIRYDFNDGTRLLLLSGKWTAQIERLRKKLERGKETEARRSGAI